MKTTTLCIFLSTLLLSIASVTAQSDSSRKHVEAFPIVSYDSDIGFGYGGKLFLFDVLQNDESLDLLLFNSTKGEQWYRIVFSIPDFESRQGTGFPVSVDVVAEYDKYSNYTFYSKMMNISITWDPPSMTSTITEYNYGCTLEKIRAGLLVSSGVLKSITTSLGILYNSFTLNNFSTLAHNGKQSPFPPKGGSERYFSILFNTKWDTRNSQVHPTSGLAFTLEAEYALKSGSNSSTHVRGLIALQLYKEAIFRDCILALRASYEMIYNSKIPSYFKTIPVGGNNTVRGLPMDRYRYGNVLQVNSEVRFPVWWKIGGIVGMDAAKGSGNFHTHENTDWLFSAVTGVRFYMDNFVVRADFGLSEEGSGLYLNFGHVF